MQILAIVIYHGDDRRIVRFKTGQLNVLPGWSRKGKSSLLEIAEFCLGRNTPTYPGGELDVVTWFGLLADFNGMQVFFGRPAPQPGAATASSAMLIEGVPDVPEAAELTPNTNTSDLRKRLGKLLGIPEDDTAAGIAMLPRATSGQALLFCFQRQGEVANANQLFHRANEDGKPRSIRDSLPFFLGAADSDHLADQQRLRDLRSAARDVEKQLEQVRADASQLNVRSIALLNEAISTGLTETSSSVEIGEQETVRILRSIDEALESRPRDPEPDRAAQEANLRTRLQGLNLDLRRVQERRAALHALRQIRSDYGSEVREQERRLRSLELLPQVEDGSECPVCGSGLHANDTTTDDLRQVASDLRKRLQDVRSLEPERRRLVGQLHAEQIRLRQEIRSIQDSLATLASDDLRLSRLQGSERQAYVRGKIRQFLESVAPTQGVQLLLLEQQHEQFLAQIARLDDALDPSGVANRMSAALSYINGWMSEWSRQLGLEYERVLLDPNLLTVVAERRTSLLPLDRIGSADNAVGYHVTAHAALHRWFIEEDRPVPRFLFLDQPEQAFFPEHLSPDILDPSEEIADEDWDKVRNIYTFLHEVAESLNGALQIIVVGHAKLDELVWFDDVMVEDWKTSESGLVPSEWISATEEIERGDEESA